MLYNCLMLEDKNFMDVRQNISTQKQKTFSIVSNYYDNNLPVITENGHKCNISNLHSDYFMSLFDIKGAYRKLTIKTWIIWILTILFSVGIEFVRSFFTFKFIGFEPGFLKYIVFELSILVLYVNFSYSIIKNIMFKKFDFSERQVVLNNMMSINNYKYVNNSVAIEDTLAVISNAKKHYFGNNKKIGINYLNKIEGKLNKRAKKTFDYDAVQNYQQKLNKIDGHHSVGFAIFTLIIGLSIQIFQIIDCWSSIEGFKIQIIVSSIAFPFIFFFAIYFWIKDRYYDLWLETETDYLVFNYQYLPMPYTEQSSYRDYNLPCEITNDIVKEELIQSFKIEINKKSNLNYVVNRSFEFVDSKIIRIYGLSNYDYDNIIGKFNDFYNKNKPEILKKQF